MLLTDSEKSSIYIQAVSMSGRLTTRSCDPLLHVSVGIPIAHAPFDGACYTDWRDVTTLGPPHATHFFHEPGAVGGRDFAVTR